jgi:hypothetical protein
LPGAVLRQPLASESLKKQTLVFESEIIAALWPEPMESGRREPPAPWEGSLADGTAMTIRPEAVEGAGWRTGLGLGKESALWGWLKEHAARPDDALLVEILDMDAHRCRLTFEPCTQRDESRIAQRNADLAEAALAVCKSHRRAVWWMNLPPALLARRVYHDPCPPDALETILKSDERFLWDLAGFTVKAATRYDQLYRGLGLTVPDILDIFEEGKPRQPTRKRPPRKELAKKVYRLHAALRYRKDLWRRIEIRGDQPLAKLDAEMRAAFGHDPGDHLSEFYLGTDQDAEQRGLGDHYPFGGGEGDEWLVGELGLESGDELSYTYDFGDNIQHVLKLEAIVLPERGAEYPRVVEQNKPRHRYCEHCKEHGKKEIASWICITCSNEQQRRVLICEEHLDEHEDHYTEEMVY